MRQSRRKLTPTSANTRPDLGLSHIAVVDNHAHPLLVPEAAARRPFASFFTESDLPAYVQRHAAATLTYRRALAELARLLECEADEGVVLDRRASLPLAEYLQRLGAAGNIEAVLLDDGYPTANALSVDEIRALVPWRVHRIVRLEPLLESLIPGRSSLDDIAERFLGELERLAPQIVALKSIIAYRSGLALGRPARHEVELELRRVQEQGAPRPLRLTSKAILDHFVLLALAWSAERRLPFQLHTGFGDRDVDLLKANPLLLRPVLEDARLAAVPIVLLHAGYPYVREAAYLASIYPNVYVDLSLAVPMLWGEALEGVLTELLALAPATKVLYGSDAAGIPDLLWLGACWTRQALESVLRRAVEYGMLTINDAFWVAERVLRANALELYGIGKA